jgi:hypothetical protein
MQQQSIPESPTSMCEEQTSTSIANFMHHHVDKVKNTHEHGREFI